MLNYYLPVYISYNERLLNSSEVSRVNLGFLKKKKKERKQREEIKKFCHKNLASIEIGETIPYYYFISSLSLSRLPRYKVFKAVRRLWTSPRPSDPHVLLVIRLSWNLGGQLRDDKNGKRLKITLFLRYLTGNRK